jgi:hypothetical protein
MVDEQIKARGVRNERVLSAMRAVPRHGWRNDRGRTRAALFVAVREALDRSPKARDRHPATTQLTTDG